MLRRSVSIAVMVITGLLLQSTVFSQIKLLGVMPELMYLVVVVVAVLVPPLTVAVSSCVAPETTVAVVGVTLTVMLGSVAATVKRNPRVSKNVRLADKARTVKLKVLARTGTPEIMPVVELKASPAGSVPEEME